MAISAREFAPTIARQPRLGWTRRAMSAAGRGSQVLGWGILWLTVLSVPVAIVVLVSHSCR